MDQSLPMRAVEFLLFMAVMWIALVEETGKTVVGIACLSTMIVIVIRIVGIRHSVMDYQAAMIEITGISYFGLCVPRLMQKNRWLERFAYSDALTGLLNRRRFIALFGEELERSKRYGKPLSLILFDVDHFKAVNDRHGHGIGDKVLVELVARCGKTLREQDLLGRLGGEEFIVLLPEIALDGATVVAKRLRREIAGRPFLEQASLQQVAVSLGVGLVESGDSFDRAFARVDKLLYRAKESGRNRAVAGDGLTGDQI